MSLTDVISRKVFGIDNRLAPAWRAPAGLGILCLGLLDVLAAKSAFQPWRDAGRFTGWLLALVSVVALEIAFFYGRSSLTQLASPAVPDLTTITQLRKISQALSVAACLGLMEIFFYFRAF